jgi:peptidoglycan/LPS O-acetylase OafA/YrhL
MPTLTEANKDHYRPEIQGLRALAVIAVIINHFSKDVLPSGYLGVDIFFVISGFVITSLLSNTPQMPLGQFILEFYERRIKRLFPALLLCVLVTCIVSMMFIAPDSGLFFGPSWHTGLAALVGLSNMYLLSISFDYFGGSAELNPYTQTWSLGVEEQFYLFYPILFWLASRFASIRNRALLVGIGVLIPMSLFLFIGLNEKNQAMAFYLMPTRFWELGIGCIAFLLANAKLRNTQSSLLSTLTFFSMIASTLFLSSFPVVAVILVVLFTGIFLATVSTYSSVYRGLTLRPLMYVGLISYPLYLWHWSVLSISRWTIGIDWWTVPLQLALMFGLAAATNTWLELPLKELQWSKSKRMTVAYGLAAVCVSALVVSMLGGPLKGLLYAGGAPERIDHLAKTGYSTTPQFTQATQLFETVFRKCNLTPDVLPEGQRRAMPDLNPEFIQNCVADQKPKITLVGDSFAQVIAPHLAMIATKMNYEFKSVLGYGCPFPFTLEKSPYGVNTKCRVDVAFLKQQLVESINPGDVVVLRLSYSKNQYMNVQRNQVEARNPALLSIYDSEIENLSSKIFAKGGALLVVGSNVTFESVPACNNRQWFNTLITRDCEKGASLSASYFNRFVDLQDQHFAKVFSTAKPKLAYLSIMGHLCDAARDSCKTSEGGTYLYDDDSHLNAAGIDLIAEDLQASLQRLSVVTSQ